MANRSIETYSLDNLNFKMKTLKDLKIKIKKIINLIKPYKPLYSSNYVSIFSHPRSGTHFLESFLGENFYKNSDLSTPTVNWGHWANRKHNPKGNKYGKLYGSHHFPTSLFKNVNYPILYIYRDGRAVAYSVWKTENFLHPKYKNISFSEFLRIKLDWQGSPAWKSKEKYTIAEHWEQHVLGWLDLAAENDKILIIQYENLVDNPYGIYKNIHAAFFEDKYLKKKNELIIINKAVGLKPNKAKKDAWKEAFTEEDNSYFLSKLKKMSLPK